MVLFSTKVQCLADNFTQELHAVLQIGNKTSTALNPGEAYRFSLLFCHPHETNLMAAELTLETLWLHASA